MAVHFIPDDLVLTIHADLLQRYGGRPGLRDRGLLESALAQPKMMIGGKHVTELSSTKQPLTASTCAETIRSSTAINGLLSS